MDHHHHAAAGVSVSRRQFFKISAAGMSATSLAVIGMAPATAQAEVRQYKLSRATEVRNTCTYCSVGCGLLMYSLGDGAKNAKAGNHPHRRRSGSPGQPWLAVPQRRWPAGLSSTPKAV